MQKTFEQRYHWSLMQVEYSTDLVFRSQETLAPLYEQLSRQAVLGVKAEQIATFLGKKITPQLAQEVGNRLATRIEGTCIKHRTLTLTGTDPPSLTQTDPSSFLSTSAVKSFGR